MANYPERTLIEDFLFMLTMTPVCLQHLTINYIYKFDKITNNSVNYRLPDDVYKRNFNVIVKFMFPIKNIILLKQILPLN